MQNQNAFVSGQVLESITRGAGKYTHGMTDGAIHREMKSSVGYNCPLSDIQIALVRLVNEKKIELSHIGHKTFYGLFEDATVSLLDQDVARHCCQA